MGVQVLNHALNVGVVDRNKLHRVDLARLRLAAEDQTNFMCEAVGRAFLRPGTEYLNATKSNAKARLIPFVAGIDDSFVCELTDSVLRIIDGDNDDLVTRPSVTSTVTAGDFSSGVGWTLASTSGQTSQVTGGELQLSARAHGARASCKQQVTTSSAGTEHALRIVVTRGPVTFRLGSSEGGAEYLPNGQEITLRTGTYSIAFTPSGSYWVQFSTESQVIRKVTSVTVEAAGVMELPTPWPLSVLKLIRFAQSLDVMFLACDGYKQKRIERYGDTSWGIADYDSDDGPFLLGSTAEVTLTPAATEGNTTLTANLPFFTANHVGALFRLYHQGQKVETYLAGANRYTPAIEVTGVNETNYNERDWTNAITGTWSGTLRTQRSFDDIDAGYHNFRRETASSTVDITANATYTNDDNEDNAITFYRVGFEQGTYTSGEAAIALAYDGGGGFGICRVVGFTSSTVVDIEVLVPFKGKHATEEWREGAWSAIRGYPSAVALHDGRLWWGGSDQVWGSVSDAFASFDEEFVGDAGPISRSIALGGRNNVKWMLALNSLMMGTDARIANARASSLDEVLTPDNFGNKSSAKIGAAGITPAELSDDRALFVESAGNKVFELSWSNEKSRYIASPFSLLTADLFANGIEGMDVQVLPDQRIWIPVTDDDAVCVVLEPSQEVSAHIPIATTSGDVIESICVLPASGQDRVYMSVKRTVDGSTVRYVEKLAKDSEALPATVTKCVDSHVTGTGAHSATIALPHLIGRTVVAWVDGDAVNQVGTTTTREFTVDGSGNIELPVAPTAGYCVGVPYRARYKSARLAYGVENTTSILKNKSIAGLGILLADYVRSGVEFSTKFDDAFRPVFKLPKMINGQLADDVVTGPGADEPLNSIGSEIGFDTRVCIEANSPKPLSILSLVLAVENYG